MFTKYYQDELIFLREMGREFALAHPAVAHLLASSGSDPDVERLLEGFAFMAAQVREKLDDELPELTHELMGLLWPHYLRPVPSMAIVEFAPLFQTMRQTLEVPRGAEVQSVPVEGTACRFRTTSAVALHPISLEDVRLDAETAGPPRLVLRLRFWNGTQPGSVGLSRLRLHCAGDVPSAGALHLALCRHARSIAARVPDAAGRNVAFALPGARIEPAGFAEEEALLPYPRTAFSGYRLLQEYFALPSKFLFADLVGLEALRDLRTDDLLELVVQLDRPLPPSVRPSPEQVRLYCVPVVNLFATGGDPIRVDHRKVEYRIRPEGRDPFHFEVFSVDRVFGYLPGTAEERTIPPFVAFEPERGGATAAYQLRRRSSVVDDRTDVYVAFADAEGARALPPTETVSFALTCTNRRLPEVLRAGDIQVPTDTSPEFVRFRNLAAPTPSVPPPLGGDLSWRLLSHLSLNYLSLASVEGLRGILSLYNFQAARDRQAARANELRLEAIQKVAVEPMELLYHGAPVRGRSVSLEVREDRFAGDGDLVLFASVLDQFMALYASVNSFSRLTVRGVQQGEVYAWPPRLGRQIVV